MHCDTTYSDSSAPDGRGSAVAAVEMQGQEVRLRGILADGRGYDFTLDDPFVGRQTMSGRWVKARLHDGYRLVSGDGARSLSYAELSQEEVAHELKSERLRKSEVKGSERKRKQDLSEIERELFKYQHLLGLQRVKVKAL